MAIQFNFRASNVAVSLPPNENAAFCGAGPLFTTGPLADPVSDAINQVRFTVTGAAPPGDLCGMFLTIRTSHRFDFQPTEAGRLTASTFYTPVLTFALACAGEGGLFEGFDKAGPVLFSIFT